jgi:hypothetical protein
VAVITEFSKGFGSVGLLLLMALWGVATQGLGLEPLAGLRLALGASMACVWFIGRRMNRTGARGALLRS